MRYMYVASLVMTLSKSFSSGIFGFEILVLIVILGSKLESVFYFVILSSLQTGWLPKLFFKESKFESPNVELSQ